VVAAVIIGLWVSQGAWAEQGEIRAPLGLPPVEMAVGADGSAVFDCSGVQWLSLPGEPDIPWKVTTVLLPPGAVLETVTACLVDVHFQAVPGKWMVRPARAPVRRGPDGEEVVYWPKGKTIVEGHDADVYGRDALWPQETVRVLRTSRLRGWRLAQVGIPLVRANPVSGALERLGLGQVVVSYQEGAIEAAQAGDLRGVSRVRRIAANFHQQKAAYARAAAAGELDAAEQGDDPPRYVIITTENIVAQSDKLEDFETHKEGRGFTVQVKTADPTDPNWYDPNLAPETIRGWLQDNYVSLNIEYVLLIGNPDPTNGEPNDAIPMKWALDKAATDTYYAELTGDWDLDPNVDDPSLFDTSAEVLVGRIPCYTGVAGWQDDLDGILQALIDYQSEDDPNAMAWRRNVLLPMHRYYEENPTNYHFGEEIKDKILIPEGWSYHRVYDDDFGLDPEPETTPCTYDNVTDAWKSSPYYGLVVWAAHGWATYAGQVMNLAHVPELDANYPSFTYQASCSTAFPVEPNNLTYALLKNGAICAVGATLPCIIFPGPQEGTRATCGIGYHYAAGLVVGGFTSGEALFEAKQILVPTMWADLYNYAIFNIYGDPDTRIFPPMESDPNYLVHNITQDVQYGDIQSAIDDANDADVIVLSPGVYDDPNDREIDFGGKAITLRSIDPYEPNIVAATVIDPNGAGRAFHFHSDEGPSAIVSGLTIRNGYAEYGGGIYCEQSSSPTIQYCVIENNEATAYGGGVFCIGVSNAQILFCTLTGNSAPSGGGIVCAMAMPTIQDCVIHNNHSTQAVLGFGGGIVCYGLSNPLINRCHITGNTAALDAGGILCWLVSSPTIIDCMITDNEADRRAGGIYLLDNCSPTILNCTIAGNEASDMGGGILCSDSSPPAIVNCIFWGDTAEIGNEIALRNESTLEFLYCDVEGDANDAYVEPNSTLIWDPNFNLNQDPCFADDANGDYHLTKASPCAETGDPNITLETLEFWAYLDVDREGRIVGDQIDMGADECSAYHRFSCGSGGAMMLPLMGISLIWLARRRR